jgi:AMP deaminase
MKKKIKTEGSEIVLVDEGNTLTLEQVFKRLKVKPYDVSIDSLDVTADNQVFHRFDRFNSKYNPFGQPYLRDIFLKTDNYIQGRYLAEIT